MSGLYSSCRLADSCRLEDLHSLWDFPGKSVSAESVPNADSSSLLGASRRLSADFQRVWDADFTRLLSLTYPQMQYGQNVAVFLIAD